MQKHKRRSLTLMILGALGLVVGLVWMAQDATTVMAHDCPRADDPIFHDDLCGTHTPEPPTNTNTPRPTSTPTNTNTPRPTSTPTNTNTPRPTSTPRPTNTPTVTSTPKPGPTYTPAPTNTPRPGPTYTPTPTNTPTATYTAIPTNVPTSAPLLTSTPRPTATSAATPKPALASKPATPCIVTHAATPAQLCVTDEGIQYYFIGPDGVQAGPYLSTFNELAETHSPVQAVAELYSGTNPMSGKPVLIDYLPIQKVIRISTYYADTPYSMNKPYIFTVNTSYEVKYQAW